MTQPPLHVLIVGATSAIAHAAARQWAERGARLALLARDLERAEALAQDLRARGAAWAQAIPLDVDQLEAHPAALEAAREALGGLDVALIAHGVLPDPAQCAADPALGAQAFHTNAVATLALGAHLANTFEAQGRGTLAVLSSVAGDRGRASNYLYGASKAAVSTFFEGLRARLWRAGVEVVILKPGFVDTPMTAHLPQGPLFASAEGVGAGVVRAIDRGRGVVYLPWFWRPIMAAVRAIPGWLMRRLSF